jgi:hypothetical protein
VLQRLLLLPLLSPLLAVLLVAAVNPRPWVSVRLLTWSSPNWPLGGWIATAAALGAAVSSAGAALALQGQGPGVIPQRQVRWREASREPEQAASREPWGRGSERPAPEPTPSERSWAGPSRSPQEPAPTVSVPFRVIRKGASTSKQTAPEARDTTSTNNNGTSNDDWATSLSDDW